MSTQKTDWVNLQVTMTEDLKTTFHRLCRTVGTNASSWARNLMLDALPELAARAQRRESALIALASEEILPGSRPAPAVAKTGNAAGRKERKAWRKARR